MRDGARQRLVAAFRRDLWITVVPALLLVAGAFALAFHFSEPASPRAVVIAAPTDEGDASWFARRYKEILARDGVASIERQRSQAARAVRIGLPSVIDTDDTRVIIRPRWPSPPPRSTSSRPAR